MPHFSKYLFHLMALLVVPLVAIPFFMGLEILIIIAQANNQRETDELTQERYQAAVESIARTEPIPFDIKLKDLVKRQNETLSCMQLTGAAEFDRKTVKAQYDKDHQKMNSSKPYTPRKKENCPDDLRTVQNRQKNHGYVAPTSHPDGHKTTMNDKNGSMHLALAALNHNAAQQLHNEFIQNCRSCALESYCANVGEGSHVCSAVSQKFESWPFVDYLIASTYASVRGSDSDENAMSQLQIATALEAHREQWAAASAQLTRTTGFVIDADHNLKEGILAKVQQSGRNTAARKINQQVTQLTAADSAMPLKMDRLTTTVPPSAVKTN